MLIKKNSVYNNKLINYLLDNCDSISVKVYNDQHSSDNKRTMKIILDNDEKLINDIIENYSNKKVDAVYKKYKNCEAIFNTEYDKMIIARGNKKEINENEYTTISTAILHYIYEYKTNLWLSKYNNYLYFKDDVYSNYLQNMLISTIYYIKMNDSLKKEIIQKKSLLDWNFPNQVEDISFYKEKKCLLQTVSHEEMCWLYCYTEDEYELYKNMGVEFVKTAYDEQQSNYAPYYDEEKKEFRNI